MRILAILIIVLSMGVLPYSEPVHHVFTMDYEREICAQAHEIQTERNRMIQTLWGVAEDKEG